MKLKHGVLALTAAGTLAAMPVYAATHTGDEQKPKQEEAVTDEGQPTAEQSDQQAAGAGQAGGQQQDATEDEQADLPSIALTPAPVGEEFILAVQRTLQDQGYAIRPDGIWGPSTRQALMEFQRDQNLEASGQISLATLDALGMEQLMQAAQGQQAAGAEQGQQAEGQQEQQAGAQEQQQTAEAEQDEQAAGGGQAGGGQQANAQEGMQKSEEDKAEAETE